MKYLISILFLIPSLGLAAPDIYAKCAFYEECIEAFACRTTDYQFMVKHDDNSGFIIELDGDDIFGMIFDNHERERTSTLIGQTEYTYHMLTITFDGYARYTVHSQGPQMASYTGFCQMEGA